jgi:hypothetical protein
MARCWNNDGVGELISPRRTVRGTTCISMVPRALPSIDSGGVCCRIYLHKRSYVLKKGFNKKFGYPKGYTYIHALMENKTTKEK